MFAYGLIYRPEIEENASAAITALDWPICLDWNKNCLFKLDNSMVSMSIISIWIKPERIQFFNISHPNAPAPTMRTLQSGRNDES